MIISGNTSTKNISQKIRIITQIIAAVFALFIITIYIIGQFFIKNPMHFDLYCEQYMGRWTWEGEFGNSGSFVGNDTLNIARGEAVSISTVLPHDLRDDAFMYIKTGRSFTAYIDGDERTSVDLYNTHLPGKNVKSAWIPIKLGSEDSGKTLTIIRTDKGVFNGYMHAAYLGNDVGFLSTVASNNIVMLLLSFALILFCTFLTVICLYLRIHRHKSIPLLYLTVGILASAIWLILDSYVYQFLFRNYFIDGTCEYLLVMMLPFPFIYYLNEVQHKRYQNIYNVLLIYQCLFFATTSLLHFSDTLDFERTLIASNLSLGLHMVIALVLIVIDMSKKKNSDYRLIAIGFWIFVTCALGEIIVINLPHHTNDGIFVTIGLMGMLICSIFHELFAINNLQKKSIAADASNKAKSDFLANMSHEIRTPINAIMGMNELVLREPVSDTVKEYSDNIKLASNTLLDLVNDILDLSKIEQGKMELIEDEYNLPELINTVVSITKVKATEKDLDFFTNVSNSLPTSVFGDAKRVREIMINLLNNAVKYTPSGSVTFHVYVQENDSGVNCLCFSVKDTGIGIKDEDRERLFGTFERLDTTLNKNIEGSGLGLAITSSFIKLMNGTITFESVYGHGTKFTVRIPQRVIDATTVKDFEAYRASHLTAKAVAQRPLYAPEAEILIVDDNILNLKVAAGLLSITKAHITICQSGSEMLRQVVKNKYHIILLDHMMPDMDGIETLRRSHDLADNLNNDTPVIALTANAIKGAKEMYIENGFTDYLSKPMEGKDLMELLRKYLPKDLISEDSPAADSIETESVVPASDKSSIDTKHIDRAVGIKYCGNLPSFFMETLELYNSVYQERVDKLNEFLADKNYKQYQIAVHSLKSSSLTCGAVILSEMARELETACKEGNTDIVDAKHEALIAEYECVFKEAEQILQE